MAVTLITFATPNFYYGKAILVKSTRRHGITDIRAYTGVDFAATTFYKDNIKVASSTRGAGYWLWKPYYILQTLNQLNYGDIAVYCDSGVSITADLEPLIAIAEKSATGMVLFENYQASGYFARTKGLEINEHNLYLEFNRNRYWTKRDAFVLMGVDRDNFWNSQQVDANFQVFKKTEASVAFVTEWLNFCCNEQIISDLPNHAGLPDFDNFMGNRHDQSIISLLAEKHKVELYRCPSQYGNHFKLEAYRKPDEFLLLPYSNNPKLNSPYATLLNHHRRLCQPFIRRVKDFIKNEIRILKAEM